MTLDIDPGPILLDLAGLRVGKSERDVLRHPNTGGVILFARNFQSRAQVTALVAEIRQLRAGLLVAVDHEGGRVQRFKTDGFTVIPPMRAVGALWDSDARVGALDAMKAATAIGVVIGGELRACGIDLSFTPVLDLDHGPSGVIGDRSFHRDPRVVATLARCLNQGLALMGMTNCGKHFPGHGFAAADSHVALPVDERDLTTILADDAAPYEWLGPAVAAVMPAHVVYPAVDSLPAGFSPVWLRQILREKFDFAGVIFSDDLVMAGARVVGDVVRAADVALNAGCDMVLVCNAPDEAKRVLAQLRAKGDTQRVSRLNRIAGRPALGWDALMQDEVYLTAVGEVTHLRKAP